MRILPLRRSAVAAIVLSCAVIGASIVLADPASPVSISDVDSPDPVASGAQITHSITIVNNGGAKINNVVMSDQLNGIGGIGVPPQLQIASSRGSCAQSGTLVTCNGGIIEGNGSWTISIRGIVTAANGTVLNNTVSVTGTKSAQNFTTTNTTTTLVSNGGNLNVPELSINKTGPTNVVVSSPMTYTLTVNNTGTQNATGVRVIDTVPAGVTGITAAGTSLFVCDVVGQTVTCDQGAVNQGSNATITISGTSPAAVGTITNTAVVDPDNTIVENNELNNTSALVNTQVTLPTEAPQLGLNITDDPSVITGAGPSDPVVPGQLLTYKILATNNAPTRADDVVIVLGTQGLEASSVFVNQIVTNGAVGTHGGCTNVSPQAKCVVRSLNSGGTILMTVSGYVIGSAGSFMIGTATVTGNIRNTGYTNTDTELTTVMPQFDLTITKADSPDPVCAASFPGGPGYPAGPGAPVGPDYLAGNTCRGGLTYTFVIGNSGIQPATGVTVRDPLPNGVIFDSFANVDGAGFNCGYDIPTNVVTCTGGTIPAQSTRTLKFVTVAPPGLGQITNTVTVDPNNAIFEADESNNTFAQTTQVATGIDLTVSKHSNHEADFVATKGTLTYTIKVSNLGTQDSTNIHVRDTLPADTIFRDAVADPQHGFSCSQSGGVVDCITGRLQGTQSMNYPNLAGPNVDTATITIRVFATPYEQPAMQNQVRVDPLNQIGEVNENNNLAVQNTEVKSGGTTNHAFNELTISKIQQSPDQDTPLGIGTARNAVVTYIVKVGNDGTDPVVGVKVRDTLPAGARYIEATGTNSFLCQQQLVGFIDCVGGQIAANTPTAAGATITIKAFAPDTPGTYTNQVEADPDHTIAEGNEFNNNASAQTVVKNGGAGSFHELSVTKTQTSPLPANNTARNAVVTYSIVVTNKGTDAVNGVVVRDKLPAGSRYIQATGTNQFLCTEAQTGIVDCVNGQVNGGNSSATITLKMFAPDTPGDYVNQVNVDPDNTIPEGDEFNNQAIADMIVTNAGTGSFNDLGISFQAAPASTNVTTPLGAITYRLDVFNYGTNAALNVSVRNILPAGVTFVSAGDASPGAGSFTCSESEGIVDCFGATITGTGVGSPAPFPPGQRTIVINVTAPNHVSVLSNAASADPDNVIPEGDEDNNTAVFLTSVQSLINLNITKHGPEQSSQGSPGQYDIVMTNQPLGAGETAYRVKMVDPLPVGLIPLATDAGDGNNWQCAILENPINVVECVGDLEPNKPVTIKVFVFMTADSQPFDNEACFVANPDVPPGIPTMVTEYNPPGTSDNCSTATTVVGNPPTFPDLFVTKSAEPAQVAPGEELTYTVLVQNNGSAKAKSPLTLTDNLDTASVTFLSAVGTNGWTCTGTGPVVCHDGGGLGLGVGDSATITLKVKVKDTTTLPFGNQAIASAALHDPVSDPTAIDETPGQPNNTATVTTSVAGSGTDLAISTILDTPDPVAPGQGLKYTVIAVNGGSAAADGVHVSITLPTSGTTFVSAAGSNGFDCAGPVAGVLDCSGDLPAGESTIITVSLTVNVAAPLPDDLHLTATIDPGFVFDETDEGNNTQAETTTISGTSCTLCVDLVSAQIVPSADPINSGDSVTLTYQVVNVGDMDTATQIDPSTGTLLSLNATIDGGFGVFTPGAPVSNNPNVTCTSFNILGFSLNSCKGHLAPGEGATITLTLSGAVGSSILVEGKADPTADATEFIETNNNVSQTIKINP